MVLIVKTLVMVGNVDCATATKAGILGFSRQIAVDYAKQGIRVNSGNFP